MTTSTITSGLGAVAPAAASAAGVQNAPRPGLPGEHFAAALFFFVCGGVGLVLVAPDLANGLFFLPSVAAVAHLFVLGWVVLSIFGALCQFLPVAVGKPMRWTALAHASFVAQVTGVLVFVCGLVHESKGLLHAGATLLTAAFTLFALNLGATLASAKERSLTWWALAGATLFLLVIPAYGVVLALNLHGEVVVQHPFTTVAVHAHVALLGFVLLVVVGVAQRLLPMFLLAHGVSDRAARASVALLFAAASVLAVPWGGGARFLVGGVLGAAGVLAFLFQAVAYFRHRMRRGIDPGMRLAAAGLFGLLAALLLAPFALGRGVMDLHLLATYFVVLLGAVSLFVAGHYYKIVPFIVWYHRFGPQVGLKKVPKVAELYSEKVALLDGALLVGGWAGLALGIYLGNPTLVRASALAFTAGGALEAVVLARVARRRLA